MTDTKPYDIPAAKAARKSAEVVANELFNLPSNQVPARALEYVNVLIKQTFGGGSEVIITAYAHYLQIEHGFKAVDNLYKVTAEEKKLYSKDNLEIVRMIIDAQNKKRKSESSKNTPQSSR